MHLAGPRCHPAGLPCAPVSPLQMVFLLTVTLQGDGDFLSQPTGPLVYEKHNVAGAALAPVFFLGVYPYSVEPALPILHNEKKKI